MSEHLKVACVQLTSTADIGRNIDISSELIREAHGAGAQCVAQAMHLFRPTPNAKNAENIHSANMVYSDTECYRYFAPS